MQVIENIKIKEKMYIEKLSNGLTVVIIPKAKIKKKYITWGVNFGSIDNKFILDNSEEVTKIPDGVAHYLEHKMFEQRSRNKCIRYFDKFRSRCKCIYYKYLYNISL